MAKKVNAKKKANLWLLKSYISFLADIIHLKQT